MRTLGLDQSVMDQQLHRSEVERLLQRHLLQQQQQHRLEDGSEETNSADHGSASSNADAGKRKRGSNEDPMSHRIIEKRRRDRMNNCLADLSRLIPSAYLKKGRGRIEKTEIIEMAIKHIKHLQVHAQCRSPDKCAMGTAGAPSTSSSTSAAASLTSTESSERLERSVAAFCVGYQECMSEVVHFLRDKESLSTTDPFCVRAVAHLQRHYERLNRPKSQGGHGARLTSSLLLPSSAKLESPMSEQPRLTSATEQMLMEAKVEQSDSDYASQRNASSSDSIVMQPQSDQMKQQVLRRKSLGHIPLSSSNVVDQNGASNVALDLAMTNSRQDEEQLAKYKFKDNMRERFSHEHPGSSGSTSPEQGNVDQKRRRVNSESSGHKDSNTLMETKKSEMAALNMLSFAASAVSSKSEAKKNVHIKVEETSEKKPTDQSKTALGFVHQSGSNVPIFALHPRGSYYVPLSLDVGMLATSLGMYTEETESILLHPVTISVNFCGPSTEDNKGKSIKKGSNMDTETTSTKPKNLGISGNKGNNNNNSNSNSDNTGNMTSSISKVSAAPTENHRDQIIHAGLRGSNWRARLEAALSESRPEVGLGVHGEAGQSRVELRQEDREERLN